MFFLTAAAAAAPLPWSVDLFGGENAHENGQESAGNAGHAVEVVNSASVVELQLGMKLALQFRSDDVYVRYYGTI